MAKEKIEIKRGMVFWVDLHEATRDFPHMQKGKRPCVVVSNNKNNNYCDIIQIVPLTTQAHELPMHTHVFIHDKKNYVLPEQICSVHKNLLNNLYYVLTRDQFYFVEMAVKIQLGLWKGSGRHGTDQIHHVPEMRAKIKKEGSAGTGIRGSVL